MKLKVFSDIVRGTIIGNPDTEITGVAGIDDAKEGDITFLSSPKYLKFLGSCKASCVIVKEVVEGVDINQLKTPNPAYAFAKAIEYFYPEKKTEAGIDNSAIVSKRASIGNNVSIAPFVCVSDDVVIGDGTVLSCGVFIGERTKIGKNCLIHPNVTIREGVTLGDRVIVHPGTVIGSDGFGYVFEAGSHYKIRQVGGVIVGDDVEIGSNVAIDRATIGDTVIGRGTKIDNLVQIAHNVKIGEKSLIVAQVGIAGSSEIGDFVTLAGQVGIADHTTVDPGTIIAAQSGVFGHLTKGVYSGSPPMPHHNWLKAQAVFAKLPEISKKLKDLEKRITLLEKGVSDDDK